MKCISVQMVDLGISSNWWKEIMKYFVKEHAELQIRCWNEESDEIERALRYGIPHIEGYETCIDGVVDEAFIADILYSDEPKDKRIYNKMTRYFTIHVSDGMNVLESAHYGTELYIFTLDENVDRFNEIMKQYKDRFSISVTDMRI